MRLPSDVQSALCWTMSMIFICSVFPACEKGGQDDLLMDTVCSNTGPQSSSPLVGVSTDWVDFDEVKKGEVIEKTVTLSNPGKLGLTFERFAASGSEFFSFVMAGKEYSMDDVSLEEDYQGEPILIEPGTEESLTIRFKPLEGIEATGKVMMVFQSPQCNDTAITREIILSGNSELTCYSVLPENVTFDCQPIGSMTSQTVNLYLGNQNSPVEIYNIHLDESTSEVFNLELPGAAPYTDSPLVLQQGAATYSMNITFTPTALSPEDENGVPIPETGNLVIVSNGFEHEFLIPLSGAGREQVCPEAIIKCIEGPEVIPPTMLHLVGDESCSITDEVPIYQWGVEQPEGSASRFIPHANFPNPQFEASVVGEYVFSLTIADSTGQEFCNPAFYEVSVIPDEAIHIELVWHTPEDLDETDTGPEIGADLDLHFVHQLASGPDLDGDGDPDPWFDNLYDCFWFNPNPNWGTYNPEINNDPLLKREDTDGAGPEIISLDVPENTKYRVGVHYWNDHGYGASYVTVRVFIWGQKVLEVEDILLLDMDMWEALSITWPDGVVKVVTDDHGNYKLTPAYSNPYFNE
jgi:hypothetical protein